MTSNIIGLTVRIPADAGSEFDIQFVQGMVNRMVVSLMKYGRVKDAYPHKVDAIASLKMRLQKYEETGNKEFLMDIGNFAMIEFMLPRHPDAHLDATVDSPGREWVTGEVSETANTHAYENVRKPIYKHEGD